jgi:hypothetical protein
MKYNITLRFSSQYTEISVCPEIMRPTMQKAGSAMFKNWQLKVFLDFINFAHHPGAMIIQRFA